MSNVESHNKLNYEQYCLLPDDGRQHEIIDGSHYMNPAPNTYHQTVSRRIQFQLMQQIELPQRGLVFNAPTDLQLSDYDIVQPDLIVVLEQHKQIVTPTKIKGIPDLVVEILSPSTSHKDQNLKLQLYLRSNIPEYWIVDPGEQEITQHVLSGDASTRTYEPSKSSKDISPTIIDGVSVDLTKVW